MFALLHPDRLRSRPRRRVRRALAAIVVGTILAGCSAGAGSHDAERPQTEVPPIAPTTSAPTTSTPPTSAPPTSEPPTSTPPTSAPSDSAPVDPVPSTELLDSILATRDQEGRMPLDGALEAFAAVYGGLPGVAPSALAPDGIEGTTAARWLSAHRDELSDAQREAVDAAMTPTDIDGTPLATADAPPPSAHGFRAASSAAVGIFGEDGCFGGSFPFADAPGAGKYKGLVTRALAELENLLGPLGIPVYTAFSEFEGVNADLNPWAPDCSQPAQACQIRLAPLALKMEDNTLLKTLAHELTHCYQARAVGATSIETLPDWMIEGFPSYVGETVGVAVGATAPNYWWDKWFKRPGIQLYQRTYDALGFYAVVEQAGGDPFGHYIAALETKASSPAFQELISGVSEHFGTIWGSTHFRQIERGLFWELDGPGATGYTPALPKSTITNGGGYASALDEGQAEADLFALQAEVVIVELTSPVKGRYSFAGAADDVLSERHEWCTLGYPCVCPDDTPRAGHVVDQAPADELAIGVAGIADGGTLSVTGMTFEEYCGPKQPVPTEPATTLPPVVDPCMVGRWVTTSMVITDTETGMDPTNLGGGDGTILDLAPDGSFTMNFDGSTPMREDAAGIVFTTTVRGVGHGHITSTGGSMTLVDNDYEATLVTDLDPGRPLAGGPGLGTGTYECGPGTLETHAPYPLGETITTFVAG